MHFVLLMIFKWNMDNWITTFQCKTIAGEEQVLIPGDPEPEMESNRLAAGILTETSGRDHRNSWVAGVEL